MSDNTHSVHNTELSPEKDLLEFLVPAESSERVAHQNSEFRTKLAQFAYNQEPDNEMSSTRSRVLRSTNPKVHGDPVSNKSKSGSRKDMDENVEDALEPPITTTNTVSPPTQSRKRKSDTITTKPQLKTPPSKKVRTKSEPKSPSTTLINKLKDSVQPGLILISIGVNPGKLTGQLGHPYSHKSNHYWPTLHKSGITPIRHIPSDAPLLMSLYGLGHTNIVPDVASSSEADLTTQQFMDGAAKLDAKIRELKPKAVMLMGRGIWYRWMQWKTGKRWDSKKMSLEMGVQDSKFWVGREVGGWEGARTFVCESPSGMAAVSGEQRVESCRVVAEWFKPLREEWVRKRHEEEEKGGQEIAETEEEEEE